MRIGMIEQSFSLKVLDDTLACIFATQAAVWPSIIGHHAAAVDHNNLFEIMTTANLEVREIVRRSDLYGAGSEFALDGRISDDRNLAADQWQPHRLAYDSGVARIIRMHRDGDIAEDRLGPRRRDGNRTAAVGKWIADIPKIAVDLLMIDLKV